MLKTSARPTPRRALTIELLEDRSVPAVLTVTSAADGGAGTLREAITLANSAGFPGADDVNFAIGGGGAQTIALTSELPFIVDTLRINGQTQPGFAGTPLITLDGTSAGAASRGLIFLASDSIAQSLIIRDFASTGIQLFDVSRVIIRGNRIGIDAAGNPAGNGGGVGLVASGAALNNIIGGPLPADANIIAFNGGAGVFISGFATIGNQVQRNSIFLNGGPGIVLDTSTGSNLSEGSPTITSAFSDAVSTTITGQVVGGAANTSYIVEFFANPASDGPDFEGRTFLGQTAFTTDGSGNFSFNVTLPVGGVGGQFLTAVQGSFSDPTFNTGAFSPGVLIGGGSASSFGSVNISNFTSAAAVDFPNLDDAPIGQFLQLAIEYEILSSAPSQLRFGIFTSPTSSFGAGAQQVGPDVVITNPANLTVGRHVFRFDGAPYADAFADINNPFILAVANPSLFSGFSGSGRPLPDVINFRGAFLTALENATLVIRGQDNNDRYGSGFGNDIAVSGDADITVRANFKGAELLTIENGSGIIRNAVILGGNGNDIVRIDDGTGLEAAVAGQGGDDFLKSGGGRTLLIGGNGNDIYALGNGFGDTAIVKRGSGQDTLDLSRIEVELDITIGDGDIPVDSAGVAAFDTTSIRRLILGSAANTIKFDNCANLDHAILFGNLRGGNALLDYSTSELAGSVEVFLNGRGSADGFAGIFDLPKVAVIGNAQGGTVSGANVLPTPAPDGRRRVSAQTRVPQTDILDDLFADAGLCSSSSSGGGGFGGGGGGGPPPS